MARPTSAGLARQVAELKKLVEQHVARTKPHCAVRVIYPEGTDQAEIERLKLEAAAEKGVDPADVTLWREIVVVRPKPCVEPYSPLRPAPYAELPDPVLGERHSFTQPDAVVIEPRVSATTAEQPEGPMEIEYPPEWKSGIA